MCVGSQAYNERSKAYNEEREALYRIGGGKLSRGEDDDMSEAGSQAYNEAYHPNTWTAPESRLWEAVVQGDMSKVQQELRGNCDPNQKMGERGQPPLSKAAQNGDYDIVCALLGSNKVAVNALSSDGYTALHFAAHNCHARVVDKLLECGADPFIKSSEFSEMTTALHETVNAFSEETSEDIDDARIMIAQMILYKYNYRQCLSLEDYYGRTPLIKANELGDQLMGTFFGNC
jgi:ankyrin repeat protein